MRRLLTFILAAVFTYSGTAQQINPVPDYIFRNQMSVGRNAATDTAAYLSVGPRFGAVKGFQPPMVVDTNAVTGVKRNGLLIFSVQLNNFAYWDSTTNRFRKITAEAVVDSVLFATRAWRQKGDDSVSALVAAKLNISDTASMLTPYVRIAGVGLTKGTQTLNADTATLATRVRVQKAVDSLGSVKQNTLTNPVTGTGTTNYVPKFTGTSAIGNSQIFDNGTAVGIGTTSPTYILDASTTDANLGRIRLVGTTNYVTSHFQNTSGSFYFGIDNSAAGLFNGGNYNRTIYSSGNYSMNFYTNDARRMTLTSAGRLLVGTTTEGTFLLDVDGTARTGTLTVNTNGQSRTISTYYGANSDGFNIFVGEGGNSSAGSVGSTFQGSYNTAFGYAALRDNTSGYSNNAIGVGALVKNTTGFQNNAMGENVLAENTTGYRNNGMGRNALVSNTTGYENNAIGMASLDKNTTGFQNTAIGYEAGRFINSGADNTTSNTSLYIGYDTRASASGNTNEIVIGSTGRGNGSNTATYGNTSIVSHVFPGGNVGINSTSPGQRLAVEGAGTGAENVLRVNNPGNVPTRIWNRNSSQSGYWIMNADFAASIGGTDTLFGNIYNTGSMVFHLNNYRDIQFGNKNPGPTSAVRWSMMRNGTFGINTTDTTYLFNVNGTSYLGGNSFVNGELLIATTTDNGDYKLQVDGNALISGNIRTSAPPGGTANDWRLGTVATVSPTSPNRTIEVSIGGTIYYIHAKTTND